MTIEQLKEHLYTITKTYFKGANVIFSKTGGIKQGYPLVTISTGTATFTAHPITVNVKGEDINYYPSRISLQIDLYTTGKCREDIQTGINTAVNDLMLFCGYLNSNYVLDKCHELDISIMPYGSVMDMSELLNGTEYEYRAMAEFYVYFTQSFAGYAGMSDKDGSLNESSSGGGSEELAAEKTGYFTREIVKGVKSE